MTLIGSAAIRFWYPDFPREPKDTDYLLNRPVPYSDPEKRVEFHDIPPLRRYLRHEVLPPSALYTLKVSHLFWDIKWDKHVYDVVFMRKKGTILLIDLFIELYAHWCRVHGTPFRDNLDQSKDDFFNNALKEQGLHDELHKMMRNPPTYTKILVGEVVTSQALFNELPTADKLSIIEEEACVMAYERLAGRYWRAAYTWQLKQLILRHLPFEQALYAIEHYYELRMPRTNYVDVIEEGLNELRSNQSQTR